MPKRCVYATLPHGSERTQSFRTWLTKKVANGRTVKKKQRAPAVVDLVPRRTHYIHKHHYIEQPRAATSNFLHRATVPVYDLNSTQPGTVEYKTFSYSQFVENPVEVVEVIPKPKRPKNKKNTVIRLFVEMRGDKKKKKKRKKKILPPVIKDSEFEVEL